jgi:excisionase family DNA binding protein
LNLLSAEAQSALVELIDRRIVEHLENLSHDSHRPWLTVAEAAEYLNTSASAIYKRIERKQIPFHRPEGHRS